MLLMDKIRHLLGYILKVYYMKYYALQDISDMSTAQLVEDAGPINCTGKLLTLKASHSLKLTVCT